jgi:lantibiotic biosynthesis protein
MASARDWAPTLAGDDARRAWDAIHRIADALADLATPSPDLALFWAYLSEATDDEQTAERTEVALARFADDFTRGFPSLDLHGGLTGAAWIAAHISDDVGDVLDEVDRVLLDRLAVERWDGEYDLMRGLVGYGVYFLARGSAPAATRGLHRITDHLAAAALHDEHGARWHTAPELLPPHQREHSPDGYDNCGVAHGVPGVVSMLARIAERPDAPPGAAALRDDAIRWLRAQHRDGDGFPCWVTDTTWVPARTAWCYGDPGVTIALRDALVRANAPGELAAIDAMIAAWSQRTETGVVDAGLCHGAVGLAHIHNRLHHATGADHHRELARRWYQQTLALERPGESIGGFPMRANHQDVALAYVLDGTAGVGLALLAAVTAMPPAWDALLLCDLA